MKFTIAIVNVASHFKGRGTARNYNIASYFKGRGTAENYNIASHFKGRGTTVGGGGVN